MTGVSPGIAGDRFTLRLNGKRVDVYVGHADDASSFSSVPSAVHSNRGLSLKGCVLRILGSRFRSVNNGFEENCTRVVQPLCCLIITDFPGLRIELLERNVGLEILLSQRQ